MDLNREELESLIKLGDFEELIGKYENAYFDCKSQIYLLENVRSKYELAKDVAAFANAVGGFVLIGIKTEKCEVRISDKISEISYVNKDLCKSRQYIDSIREWIYPRIEGISANWYASKSNPERGVFVIAIPPQSEFIKPFLINKSLIESEKRNTVLFGYSERIQDNNEPHSVEDLHKLLRDGLNYQTRIESRLQSIESILQQKVSPNPSESKEDAFDIDTRTSEALVAAEMTEKRSMIISGYPETPNNIRLLLSSKTDGPRSLIAAPPQIREIGFGTRVISRPVTVGGNLVRVKGLNRKIIDLHKDGLLLAAFRADEEFLCWGMKNYLLNPVALIETTFTLVMLYNQVLKFLSEKPREINFRIEMKNLHLNGKKNILAEGNLENIKVASDDELYYAPEDNWSDVLSFESSEFEEPEVAYALVEMVYNHFGIDAEHIPYTKEIDGERIIDTDKIASL